MARPAAPHDNIGPLICLLDVGQNQGVQGAQSLAPKQIHLA
jgi:hypothetical protein